jgi:hypothetical protein
LSSGAFVRRVDAGAFVRNPQVQVAVSIDTAYVAGNGGSKLTRGVYLVDNQLNDGSTGEGGMALHTRCPIGSLIGFSSYPIDTGSGDSVAITGFSIVQGSVFGGSGYPIEYSEGYWIGQAMYGGSQTYQIQFCVTSGALRPVKFYTSVECQLTAQ